MTSVSENHSQIDHEKRNLASAMTRGFRSKCPSCGKGRLFSSTLKVTDQCSFCGEDLYHHRADDLPAYLNIFIVGHIIVAIMMVVYQQNLMDMWTLAFVTVIAATLCSIVLMRPLKGTVVGAQWAARMHGFGGNED